MALDPPPQTPWTTYHFDGWTYSRLRLELTNPNAEKVRLTTNEHQILRIFLQHPQVILSRDFMYQYTSNRRPGSDLCTTQELRRIDVGVTRLRRKIEANPHSPDLIKTVRNEGYYFTPMPQAYPSGIHMAQFAPDPAVVDE